MFFVCGFVLLFDCKQYDFKRDSIIYHYNIYFLQKGRKNRENKQEAQILENRNKGEGIVKTTNIAYTSVLHR